MSSFTFPQGITAEYNHAANYASPKGSHIIRLERFSPEIAGISHVEFVDPQTFPESPYALVFLADRDPEQGGIGIRMEGDQAAIVMESDEALQAAGVNPAVARGYADTVAPLVRELKAYIAAQQPPVSVTATEEKGPAPTL